MEVAGISPGRVSYRDIGFGLGPRINASGRMGSPLNAFNLLVTENPVEAKNLAKLLDDGNRDRRRVEARAFEEAAARVEREFGSAEEKILVVESPDWHEGVLGIVAARLVERYHKPSIVISMKNDVGKGSGRSVNAFSLFDTVLQCEDLLMNFGGHAQACGLTIRGENLSLFRTRLNEAAREKEVLGLAADLVIDGEVPFRELDTDFLKGLDRLAPFGPGNRKPLFLSRNVRLKSQARKRGKDTLCLWMTDPEGSSTCEAVGFRMFSRWRSAAVGTHFDIVHQPSLSEFQGIASIQLELEDWRQAAG